MSEVITLSSSEEEEATSSPRKRIKPSFLNEISITPIGTNKNQNNSEDVVILSDEDDSSDTVRSSHIMDVENDINKGTTETPVTIRDDDNDSVTFIEDKNGFVTKSHENYEQDDTSDKKERPHPVKELTEEIKRECHIANDENSAAESSGKENKSENSLPLNNKLEEPSTSLVPSDIVLENFLNICGETISNSQYQHLKNKQFPILRKYYKKCTLNLKESTNFLKLIEENMERVQKSPAAAVISFNEIFQYIKELVDVETIEVSEEYRIRLKKLEKTIKLLVSRIQQIENAEIDFEDEENSAFLMLDRYTNRLNKVHEKYCQLLKKNPHSGRITYEKLDFVDSEYNEINTAINKKYKNNKKFPSYIEIEQLIKKIAGEHNLALSDATIKNESRRCFKKLGELLQSRRKKELYDAHYLYIRDSEDPADKDRSLDSTLIQNFKEGQIKIEKVCDDYCTKEKLGVEAVLSEEDSDKSNYVDSENEEKSCAVIE